MRISDWSSDVCSSDLIAAARDEDAGVLELGAIFDELVRQRDLAFLDQHHKRDAGDRLGHARDAEDRMLFPRLARTHAADDRAMHVPEHRRAQCRERVCQYVKILGVARYMKKKK